MRLAACSRILLLSLVLSSCGTQVPDSDGSSRSAASSVTSQDAAPAEVYDVTQEDFPDVTNIEFLQSEIRWKEAVELLKKNGFVVIPANHPEFFALYEKQRYRLDPNFITSDSLLHTYHLLFSHVLKKTEEEKLSALASQIAASMAARSKQQYDQLKGTAWENAAKRNLAFFSVAHRLIDPAATIPQEVAQEVEQELALIAAHDTLTDSPVMNIGDTGSQKVTTPWGDLTPGAVKEDYTQYVPRGHYDRSETLQRYFRTMMYYGRLTFRFKNPDEVKSALLIVRALDEQTTRSQWESLYEITSFFVGVSDDITFQQMKSVADPLYKSMTIQDMAGDDAKLQTFMRTVNDLPAPQINSMPVFRGDIEEDREKEIKGFRFMGQRFTLDSAIMQKLICRDVGTKGGDDLCGGGIEGSRMLPKGLDVAAAFGSEEAYAILEEMGETEYKYYPENMSSLRAHMASISDNEWTQNLYWGWLHALRPLLQDAPAGAPAFMQSGAWLRKQLTTFLGNWTELRHDTILYVKQSYAELGGGGDIPEKDDRGYVEPVPQVFERLALLARMTREGLAKRNLLPDTQRDNLARMEELSTRLRVIAEKELGKAKITDEEYELIRSYGGQIEHLWYEVNKEEMEQAGMTQADFLMENPAAIVADVATDPNGQVLEEATGYVSEIFVITEVEGKKKLLGGTVYSQFEFPWPMAERLTDARWRQMLRDDDPRLPQTADWMRDFTAAGVKDNW